MYEALAQKLSDVTVTSFHGATETLSLLGLNARAWDGKEGVGEEMLSVEGWRESHRLEAAETAPAVLLFASHHAVVVSTPYFPVASHFIQALTVASPPSI